MKFQKDILNGFQLREQTRFYDKVQKEIIPKEYMQELWFLHSALRLVLIDIYMKFIEDRRKVSFLKLHLNINQQLSTCKVQEWNYANIL